MEVLDLLFERDSAFFSGLLMPTYDVIEELPPDLAEIQPDLSLSSCKKSISISVANAADVTSDHGYCLPGKRSSPSPCPSPKAESDSGLSSADSHSSVYLAGGSSPRQPDTSSHSSRLSPSLSEPTLGFNESESMDFDRLDFTSPDVFKFDSSAIPDDLNLNVDFLTDMSHAMNSKQRQGSPPSTVDLSFLNDSDGDDDGYAPPAKKPRDVSINLVGNAREKNPSRQPVRKPGLRVVRNPGPDQRLPYTVQDVEVADRRALEHPETQTSGPLILTDEEQSLLAADGVCLPDRFPLTKLEQRTLRAVRRRIRNKESARISRRKKSEYVEALERRCRDESEQRRAMADRVQTLEEQNRSLLARLKALQARVAASSRSAKAGTCVALMMFSFAFMLSMPHGEDGAQSQARMLKHSPMPGRSRSLLQDSQERSTSLGDPYGLSIPAFGPPWVEPPVSPAIDIKPIVNFDDEMANQYDIESGLVPAALDGWMMQSMAHDPFLTDGADGAADGKPHGAADDGGVLSAAAAGFLNESANVAELRVSSGEF